MADASGQPAIDSRMGGWTGVGYDDVPLRQSWPPQPICIDSGKLTRYLRCIGRDDAVTAQTPIPAFMLNELRVLKQHMKLPPGVLHAQEELHLAAPAYADEPLTIEVSIQDKYLRNNKRFVVVAQRVERTSDATLIMTVRHTLYWPC